MNKRPILHSLKALHKEVSHKDLQGARALDIAVGSVQLLNQCYQPGLNGWMDRRGRRATFKNLQKRPRTQASKRLLSDLLTLTISAVEAARWDFWVGALPMKDPQPLSEAQKATLKKATERSLEARKRAATLNRTNHTDPT